MHPTRDRPAKIVTRLAPSPTGAQHVGNARTYLIAWLAARSRGGRVVLRIEDIDSPRVKQGAAEQALDDLSWLGLDWDGEPLIQSRQLPIYEDALRQIQREDRVYPCTCSRTDVERAASAPHAEHESPVYPGTCSGRKSLDASDLAGTPFSWRFRLPDATPTFIDAFRGAIEIDLHQNSGDFVVWKSAGTPAYQLAVVVDDAAQEVTEVIRGDDLLISTPRQILLYLSLNLTPPRFTHLPLVVGPDGRRLAKRHGDTRLSALRAARVEPERVLGLLAWSCGWIERSEPVSLDDLLTRFDLTTIPPTPFVLSPALLRGIGYA